MTLENNNLAGRDKLSDDTPTKQQFSMLLLRLFVLLFVLGVVFYYSALAYKLNRDFEEDRSIYLKWIGVDK